MKVERFLAHKHNQERRVTLKKQRTSRSDSTARGHFIAASSRVIGPVGRFGEHLVSSLVSGSVIVSRDEEMMEVADIFCPDIALGIQVSMCNGRHASRPTVTQIRRHLEAIKNPGFLINIRSGFYAFVFYIGVDRTQNGKSKILSRKLDKKNARQAVLASEIEYIYLLDSRVTGHLVTNPKYAHMVKSEGNERVREGRKIPEPVLWVNRTFMRGFAGKNRVLTTDHRSVLNEVFRPGGWRIREHEVSTSFESEGGGKLLGLDKIEKKIPVYIIGSKRNVDKTLQLLPKDRITIPI